MLIVGRKWEILLHLEEQNVLVWPNIKVLQKNWAIFWLSRNIYLVIHVSKIYFSCIFDFHPQFLALSFQTPKYNSNGSIFYYNAWLLILSSWKALFRKAPSLVNTWRFGESSVPGEGMDGPSPLSYLAPRLFPLAAPELFSIYSKSVFL